MDNATKMGIIRLINMAHFQIYKLGELQLATLDDLREMLTKLPHHQGSIDVTDFVQPPDA